MFIFEMSGISFNDSHPAKIPYIYFSFLSLDFEWAFDFDNDSFIKLIKFSLILAKFLELIKEGVYRFHYSYH